ncbi:uncharacterized protein LOC125757632 [Rhipicephalus sanguineus]|uniref:uncharacterized protein LOC125757632 n=1 Tax=Rhipicephalus sanguineus TaxID=34632 RepID=UPI0020C26837|nr:uncharacterized protein LOC125757632 [Rhipicephalus sanguineus]
MSSTPSSHDSGSGSPSSRSSDNVVYAAHFDFDPIATSSSDEESVEDGANPHDNDLGVVANVADGLPHWCSCGQCRHMESATENICCQTIAKIKVKIEDRDSCITNHPTFVGGIMNIHAIEVNYLNMMALNQEQIQAVDIHRDEKLIAMN